MDLMFYEADKKRKQNASNFQVDPSVSKVDKIVPKRSDIEKIKDTYKTGMKVELLEMDDIQAPPIGTKGVVNMVDDMGQIHVNWDNGSTLAVIPEVDKIKIIDEKEPKKEPSDSNLEF